MTSQASSVNDSVREQFGAAANAYASSAVHASGPDLAAMVRLAEFTGTEQVLDMGSGAGHCALAFGPKVARVRGIDVTPEMVAVANRLAGERGLANVSFEQGDVDRLPFEDGTFDRVTSRAQRPPLCRSPAGARRGVSGAEAGRDVLADRYRRARGPGARHVLQGGRVAARRVARAQLARQRMGANGSAARFEGAEVRERFAPFVDGADWVKRMRTPPASVAMLRELFAQATPAQRAAFDIRDEPWGLCIPFVLLTATRARN